MRDIRALCGGTNLNRLACERRWHKGREAEGFEVDNGRMKRQEVLSSHTVIAPAISVQRKLSAPPHRLPLATIVFGYLESHLKASLHCIQCAATGTAAIWILSSCPVRERENYLVVAEKRGQKEKKQRKRKSQKSFFCGTL